MLSGALVAAASSTPFVSVRKDQNSFHSMGAEAGYEPVGLSSGCNEMLASPITLVCATSRKEIIILMDL
jgi:hypothetical protein